MARTQETMHRLLHLLQHLALQRGLKLNLGKCQLLQIHSSLPISLSITVTSDVACDCIFCHTANAKPLNPAALSAPISVVEAAKYLGAYISKNGSAQPDVNYRCSQASSAFHCLRPAFSHPLISTKRKFQIYSQIVLAILLYGSESQVYTPAQISKLNALHFKALRAILRVNSSYYHRVLHPSDAPCSNEHLLSLAYPHAPYVYPPSLAISNARIRLLGHILRHPADIEHSLCFNKSLTLRTISSPYRRGAPRAHWPEIVLAESQFRFLCLITGTRPEPGNFLHPFYTHCTLEQLREWVSPHMPECYNTTRQMHQLSPLAQERELWKQLFP